ncbi:Glyoxalase/Bleomycin resistance protein/Dihydroxybiphenyl dioxygenase [Aspergillus lucknowensis]|uniref:Glyoxalase/Bleomycin resistance protein/Dihydroxybiphenyl dioxygenase n=1 Tax=Aspergillus lucknowensis TaxID=176173 RepID=A0ABR4LPW6_9EURO
MPAGLNLVTLLVHDYDPAIAFFTQTLGFTVLEDKPSLTNDGRPKRWVVVRPPATFNLDDLGNPALEAERVSAADGGASILLARADGPEQTALVGRQFAGRVGFFWSLDSGDDFEKVYKGLRGKGVEFVSAPRQAEYGVVAVFLDCYGNKWDLLGPKERTGT